MSPACSKRVKRIKSYQVQSVVGHYGLHKLEEGVSDLILIESEWPAPVGLVAIFVLLVGHHIEGLVDHMQVGIRSLKVIRGLLQPRLQLCDGLVLQLLVLHHQTHVKIHPIDLLRYLN